MEWLLAPKLWECVVEVHATPDPKCALVRGEHGIDVYMPSSSGQHLTSQTTADRGFGWKLANLGGHRKRE